MYNFIQTQFYLQLQHSSLSLCMCVYTTSQLLHIYMYAQINKLRTISIIPRQYSLLKEYISGSCPKSLCAAMDRDCLDGQLAMGIGFSFGY